MARSSLRAALVAAMLLVVVGSATAADRVVLFEESTNYGCPPCFTFNPIVLSVLNSFGDQVAPVKWHVWWPNAGDPFYNYNSTPVDQRIDYHNIFEAPDVMTDGFNVGEPNSAASMTNAINARLAIPAPLSITTSGLIAGSQVSVTVDVDIETAQAAGDHRLFVVMVEEHIDLVSPNGELFHKDVFRHANNSNNATGEFIDCTVAGVQNFNYSFPFDSDEYQVDKMLLRAWVQDYTTHEVLNAGLGTATAPYYSETNVIGSPTQIGDAITVANFAGTIDNLGDNDDTFDVTVAGVPAGWAYSYTTPAGTFSGPSTLSLNSGVSAPVSLQLDSQGNAGTATVTMDFQSQIEPANLVTFEFTKLNGADVLIVDDDRGAEREQFVEPGVAATGAVYGTWDKTDGDLTATDLENAATVVIWMTGDGTPTLDAAARAALGTFIDNGGKAYVNGTDISYDLADPFSPNRTPETEQWVTDYLKITHNTNISFQWSVVGVAGDPIGNLLSASLATTGDQRQTTPDGISAGPGSDTSMIFTGGLHDAMTRWTDGNAAVVFSSFGIEGVTNEFTRNTLIERIIEWLDPSSTAISEPELAAPVIALAQNSPNPFRPSTTITYTLGEAGPVMLRIFDVNGRSIRTLVDTHQDAQAYDVVWDGRDYQGRQAASGIYFYKLEAPGVEQTRRMVLSR